MKCAGWQRYDTADILIVVVEVEVEEEEEEGYATCSFGEC